MTKFFEKVPGGLPEDYPVRNTGTATEKVMQNKDTFVSRRRIFNYWDLISNGNRTIFMQDGSIATRALPRAFLKSEQRGFLVESRLRSINPVIPTSPDQLVSMGAGAIYDPDSYDLIVAHSRLEKGMLYAHCWKFMLDAARYLEKHPEALIIDRPTRTLPEETSSTSGVITTEDGRDIADRIDELLG